MDATPREPFLLTPGPLTTTRATKEAMLRDWGSRDGEFIAMNARVRRRLTELVHGDGSHVCVPLQGSGTFVVEAMIGTLVPPAGKLLVLVNGAYGRRMVRMCEYYRRACVVQETAEDQPADPAALDAALARDPEVTHVVVVHCETTSGVLNPVEEIAAVTARHGRRLLIDAMSAFGAIPLDARRVPFDALVASANKCLEGVPGVGFAIIRREALEEARGQAPSLSLDLHDQWVAMEKNGQWRFTPPTHVLAALDRALDQHAAEGGVAGAGRPLPPQLRAAGGGSARHGLRDAPAGPAAGADHRHGAHARRPQVPLRDLLRPAGPARLRDLPRQAHGGRQLPRRLHRRARGDRDAGRPAGHPRSRRRARRSFARGRSRRSRAERANTREARQAAAWSSHALDSRKPQRGPRGPAGRIARPRRAAGGRRHRPGRRGHPAGAEPGLRPELLRAARRRRRPHAVAGRRGADGAAARRARPPRSRPRTSCRSCSTTCRTPGRASSPASGASTSGPSSCSSPTRSAPAAARRTRRPGPSTAPRTGRSTSTSASTTT